MQYANLILKIYILAYVLIVMSGCSTSPVPTANPEYGAIRPVTSKALPINTGSIYKAGYDITLFEDVKASKVGDILTIVLSERTNASKSARTKTEKDGEVAIAAPTILGQQVTIGGVPVLSTEIDAEREFEGKGDTAQSNKLTGMITVTVAEVLANGNLVVRGEKLLTLNQGVEHIRVSGIIRSEDIRPDNTIESSKLANATIIYGGEGVIAESNTKGWLQRLIDGPYWPF